MAEEKVDKDFRVAVDLLDGPDFTERFATIEAATERAKEIMSGPYVVQTTESRVGSTKLIFYPMHQLRSVTVDQSRR